MNVTKWNQSIRYIAMKENYGRDTQTDLEGCGH
jgi:hypothetical protein